MKEDVRRKGVTSVGNMTVTVAVSERRRRAIGLCVIPRRIDDNFDPRLERCKAIVSVGL